jgi:hypothetical protein
MYETKGKVNITHYGIGTPILWLLWLGGVVIAKGFWSTFFAVLFPPWAIYLVAELLLNTYILGS